MNTTVKIAAVAFVVALIASIVVHLIANALGVEDTGIFAAGTIAAIAVGTLVYLQKQKAN